MNELKMKSKKNRLTIGVLSLSMFFSIERAVSSDFSNSLSFGKKNERLVLSEPADTDQSTQKLINQLTREADKLLKKEIGSVMDKSLVPPSGDKHDYMSYSQYWWPDLSKPRGAPYIKRDGLKNPAIDSIRDNINMNTMITCVRILSWAYFYTSNEKYAAKATELIRKWFLDPKTLMNPNLNYSQQIPNLNVNRGSGIIDSHRLPLVIEAIGMLNKSRSWTNADQIGVKKWFTSFMIWLKDSPNGKTESKSPNNHGTYYDAQLASYALFTGNDDIATAVFKGDFNRLSNQFDEAGRQTLEVQRTLGFGYSLFNLQAWVILADAAQTKGIDLWHYETKDGRSLRKAIDWILPYATGQQRMNFSQIKPINLKGLYPILMKASSKYGSVVYKQKAMELKDNEDVITLLQYNQ